MMRFQKTQDNFLRQLSVISFGVLPPPSTIIREVWVTINLQYLYTINANLESTFLF